VSKQVSEFIEHTMSVGKPAESEVQRLLLSSKV